MFPFFKKISSSLQTCYDQRHTLRDILTLMSPWPVDDEACFLPWPAKVYVVAVPIFIDAVVTTKPAPFAVVDFVGPLSPVAVQHPAASQRLYILRSVLPKSVDGVGGSKMKGAPSVTVPVTV